MNLTDKEKRQFKSTLEGILQELEIYSPYQQGQMPLNNQKYTYSYTQSQGELYVTLYCKGVAAYYLRIEGSFDKYTLSGWSYNRNKPDTQTLFTVYVNKQDLMIADTDFDSVLQSISSKERFTNLYTALCLVSQNDTFIKWGVME